MITPPMDRTLADLVVRQIRKQIILGEIPPGERLTEARLSEQLEVSRSTVREALRRLEAESLVETTSHRGARVAHLTPDDAMQISEIHSMLGVHAVRHLDLPIGSALREQLLRSADEMRGLHFPEDVDRFIELDTKFHHDIFASTHQRRVLQVWSGVSALLGILVSMSLRAFQVDGTEISLRHIGIVDALTQSETDLAVHSIVEHYQSIGDRIQTLMLNENKLEGITVNGRTDEV